MREASEAKLAEAGSFVSFENGWSGSLHPEGVAQFKESSFSLYGSGPTSLDRAEQMLFESSLATPCEERYD